MTRKISVAKRQMGGLRTARCPVTSRDALPYARTACSRELGLLAHKFVHLPSPEILGIKMPLFTVARFTKRLNVADPICTTARQWNDVICFKTVRRPTCSTAVPMALFKRSPFSRSPFPLCVFDPGKFAVADGLSFLRVLFSPCATAILITFYISVVVSLFGSSHAFRVFLAIFAVVNLDRWLISRVPRSARCFTPVIVSEIPLFGKRRNTQSALATQGGKRIGIFRLAAS